MEINQFADTSKDLYTQIKVVENLIKGDQLKEARKLLPTAEKACNNLESLMAEDNKIVNNRRLEITWIHDAIQQSMAKAKSKTARKPASKSK